jgi:hypothetical protein
MHSRENLREMRMKMRILKMRMSMVLGSDTDRVVMVVAVQVV